VHLAGGGDHTTPQYQLPYQRWVASYCRIHAPRLGCKLLSDVTCPPTPSQAPSKLLPQLTLCALPTTARSSQRRRISQVCSCASSGGTWRRPTHVNFVTCVASLLVNSYWIHLDLAPFNVFFGATGA
jgi:hypothetical protein